MSCMSDYQPRIREFLSRFIRVDEVSDDDDIFSLSLVNSLFAMQLILWLESEFGFAIDGDDLKMSNFNSVSAINSFIASKAVAATVVEG